MFDLNTLNLVNQLAAALKAQGRPEADAVKIATDPSRRQELDALLNTRKAA